MDAAQDRGGREVLEGVDAKHHAQLGHPRGDGEAGHVGEAVGEQAPSVWSSGPEWGVWACVRGHSTWRVSVSGQACGEVSG